MAKWIKNTTAGNKTYVGQQIAAAAYYEIQTHEQTAWANDSTLLTDIGSGDALVSTTNATAGNITDVGTAINHLKDELPKQVESLIAEDSVHAFYGVGTHFTATKNTTTAHDYKLPTVAWAPAGGVAYFSGGAITKDTIKVELVDVDNVLGLGAGTVLAQYVNTWHALPGHPTPLDPKNINHLPAPGLYFRLTYVSHADATADADVVINFTGYKF